MRVKTKICGLSTPDAMTAALEGGADFVGLVFHSASPRYVDYDVAAYLASYVPAHIGVVGLFADPASDILQQTLDTVRIDMIQLHGQETPEECEAIASRFRRPVMKALTIANLSDLDAIPAYEAVCDWLLLDAPGGGGTGTTFDWTLLHGRTFQKPWMLAGGLTPENVAAAIRMVSPDAVDVSSGVEITRGIKDPEKIRAFLQAAAIN